MHSDESNSTSVPGAGVGVSGGGMGAAFFGRIYTTKEFFDFCRDGTVEGIKACISQGKDPAMEEVEGGHTETSLSVAILNARLASVKTLLETIVSQKGPDECREILNKPLSYCVDKLPTKVQTFNFARLSFESKVVATGVHGGNTQYETQYTSVIDRATSLRMSYLALIFYANSDKTSISHNEALVKLLLDAGADPTSVVTPYRDGEVFDLGGRVVLPTVTHYSIVHIHSSTNIILAMRDKGGDMDRKATIAYDHDDDMHGYISDVTGCCGPAGSFWSVCCWPVCCCGGRPTDEALNNEYITRLLSTQHTPVEMLQYFAKILDGDMLKDTLKTLEHLDVTVEPVVSRPAPRAVSPMA